MMASLYLSIQCLLTLCQSPTQAPPTPDLLSKAVRKIKVNWLAPTYQWRSPTELFYVRYGGNPPYKAPCLYSIITGKETPLFFLGEEAIGTDIKEAPLIISLDGKWIAGFRVAPRRWFVRSLDGHFASVGLPISPRGNPFDEEDIGYEIEETELYPVPGVWLKNNYQWITLAGTNRKPVFVTLDRRYPERPIRKPLPPIDLSPYQYPEQTFRAQPILGISPSGMAITVWGKRPFPPVQFKIVQFNPKARKVTYRMFDVVVPEGTRVCDWALSPDGRRFAWAFGTEGTPHLELWVSDTEGGARRCIGQINWMDSDKRNGLPSVELRWHPDSKHVSLIFQGVFYLVPTESPVQPSDDETVGRRNSR